jgi:hypothetical protein
MYLNQGWDDKLTTTIQQMRKAKTISSKIRNKTGMFTFTLLLNVVLDILQQEDWRKT